MNAPNGAGETKSEASERATGSGDRGEYAAGREASTPFGGDDDNSSAAAISALSGTYAGSEALSGVPRSCFYRRKKK